MTPSLSGPAGLDQPKLHFGLSMVNTYLTVDKLEILRANQRNALPLPAYQRWVAEVMAARVDGHAPGGPAEGLRLDNGRGLQITDYGDAVDFLVPPAAIPTAAMLAARLCVVKGWTTVAMTCADAAMMSAAQTQLAVIGRTPEAPAVDLLVATIIDWWARHPEPWKSISDDNRRLAIERLTCVLPDPLSAIDRERAKTVEAVRRKLALATQPRNEAVPALTPA